MKFARSDEGTASLEFIVVAVGILMPLAYIVVTVGAIHRAHAAAAHGVREAARILMQSDSVAAGGVAAREAVALAFADHGLTPPADALAVTCSGACLSPGSQVRVEVRWAMPLPWMPDILGGPATWPIQDSQTLDLDLYRADPL